MVRVSSLEKRFDTIVAVDDVSFELIPGETFGLLGPNGAGKSTIINLIVGLLKPDRGAIVINGNDDPTRSSVRRKMGNAPQSLSLYEELSAEENLTFFGRLYGLSGKKLKERVRWSLEFAGLSDRRSDRVVIYSGGMKRRLNMACALVHDPPVLLFDEPTVGVDPQSRNAIFDSIDALKKDGRTILYTTHYMEEAQRLCDRVAILDHGKILALDKVDSLINQYGGTSIVIAEFASPPADVSSLPGEVDGTTLRFESEQPLEKVAELVASGHKFTRIGIERADLETVFLNLTGRRLRD